MSVSNRVYLLGQLTHAPELGQSARGLAFVQATLEVARLVRPRNGSPRTEVTAIRLEAFGPLAEHLARSAVAGTLLLVEGRLRLAGSPGEPVHQRRLGVLVEDFSLPASPARA